jgi:hypothetical protein
VVQEHAQQNARRSLASCGFVLGGDFLGGASVASGYQPHHLGCNFKGIEIRTLAAAPYILLATAWAKRMASCLRSALPGV